MQPNLSRRLFIAGSAVALTLPAAPRVFAQAAAAPTGPFTVPKLPYAYNALEPHIDATTMEIHSQRHHGAFITNLNNFAKDHGVIARHRSTSFSPSGRNCRKASVWVRKTASGAMPITPCSGKS